MARQGRRQFLQGSLAVAGVGLLAGCGLVSLPGQRSASVRRIGVLETVTGNPAVEAFREGLRELGYVEGQHLVVEHRSAEDNPERLPALAAELVGLAVEVIVTFGGVAVRAASRATTTIPIVSASAPVVGLVTNIARPEGNITGVSTNSDETIGKWIELLK